MAIDSLIKKLQYVLLEPPDKILSLYLNTDMRDPDQQGGEWKIALKSGFGRLKEYLAASDLEEEKCLDGIRTKIDQYLNEMGKDMPRSLVFFVSDSGIWEPIKLQIPVETRFYWEETAVLDQLKDLRQTYPSTAFILTQQHEVKIIETVLGKIEAVEHYEYDIINESWENCHSSVNKAAPFEENQMREHVTENQTRLYKRLAANLDQKAAAKRWERMVIAGDKETADILDQHMNKPIHSKIQKNLLNENEHKVVEHLIKEA
ncbi:VLRF1 family aeRF1-type release factor [Bacillus inaquosorum]|uniref:VLRF1 family aeRF1-type release factor n=1 Tax=Bacillus inaquosorum TaxID=483913 RepID=UPI0022811E6A|nr:VLRF1 family aeRF1-type release factor [Bacillus inaquosorum]MCY7985907.1 VLRF1 family aeRF1-type release factor [Bacillus inaquosorum]MCY8247975.1 VLRF1 family aeRF1-type release factor [Bacillus inaquosorum]MCY8248721.1 VLRF1 family aeRF1-type release factor [Bacillus inaquosorum]MCY8298003.1 VLRF1 family aeRF1-type release factor [Bacillus inaquosorum]MCY8706634.1 VLRF1 family aeRF1-type release factor [Bacillus inaquosorum]